MGISFASLNSGSNGNCYYVGNDTDAVLVDVGIASKEVERRMKSLNLSMQKVKAILVTHEHIDHVRGLAGLAQKFNLPIYITNKTKLNCYHLTNHHIINFNANENFSIGTLQINAFAKMHDAADAHSFTITSNNICVGVFTDIGTVCDNLIASFKKCHAAFLEANYDDDLLANGKYPKFLQDRIGGTHGHLSNKQALDLFVKHKPSFMSHLILAHLSKDNNNVELVQNLFKANAQDTFINVASRYEAGEVYCINDNFNTQLLKQTKIKNYLQQKLF
jgi:phosphoribosyl 1,2-cyclic phosphodiesterase